MVCPNSLNMYVTKNDVGWYVPAKTVILCETYMKMQITGHEREMRSEGFTLGNFLVCSSGYLEIALTSYEEGIFVPVCSGESIKVPIDGELKDACYHEGTAANPTAAIDGLFTDVLKRDLGYDARYTDPFYAAIATEISNRHSIKARLSSTFTKQDALAILKSFKVL